jgi:hypothetical protein
MRARSDVEAIWEAVFAALLSAYRGSSDKNGAENAPKATNSARALVKSLGLLRCSSECDSFAATKHFRGIVRPGVQREHNNFYLGPILKALSSIFIASRVNQNVIESPSRKAINRRYRI